LELTVLTEDEPFGHNQDVGIGDLQLLHELVNAGPAVGVLNVKKTESLRGKQMADALTEAGSEPGFFRLDDDGNSEE
jgi:hypothetical protein